MVNVFKEESQQGAQLSWQQQKSTTIGDRAPDFAEDNRTSCVHYRAPCTGHYLRLREEAKLLEGGGMEAIDSPKERAEQTAPSANLPRNEGRKDVLSF